MLAYTPERVAGICGVEAKDIYAAARLLATHRPGALLYAMGITQHATGHDNVLACAALQMLLGNYGATGRWSESVAGTGERAGRVRYGRFARRLYRVPAGGCRRQSAEVRSSLGRWSSWPPSA